MSISLYGTKGTEQARQTMSVFTAVGHRSICIRATSTAEKGVQQDEQAHAIRN